MESGKMLPFFCKFNVSIFTSYATVQLRIESERERVRESEKEWERERKKSGKKITNPDENSR